MKTHLEDQPIHDLLDDFGRAREALVRELKLIGFSDEQAHAKIMRYQEETQQIYRAFNEEFDQNKAVYDWKGRKKTESFPLTLNENI